MTSPALKVLNIYKIEHLQCSELILYETPGLHPGLFKFKSFGLF